MSCDDSLVTQRKEIWWWNSRNENKLIKKLPLIRVELSHGRNFLILFFRPLF